MTGTTKYCSGCRHMLPLNHFTPIKSGRGAGGHKSRCKQCLSAAFIEWQKSHRRRKPKIKPSRVIEQPPPAEREKNIARQHNGMEKLLAIRVGEQKCREDVIRAGYLAGTSVEELARATGKSARYVLQKALKLGLRQPNGRPTEADKKKFIDLRLSGYTILDIRCETGFSFEYVAGALREVGLSARQKPNIAHIKAIALAKLESLIIKPGFERHLQPLVEFRGRPDLGRFHRLWNMLIAMREAECESIEEGVTHFSHNPDYSHLCGPDARPQHMGLYGFTSRIILSPKIKLLDPTVYDYARLLNPSPFDLTKVAEVAHHRDHAWWRRYEPGKSSAPRKLKLATELRAPLAYPFLVHDGGKPEHELLRLINEAVPKHLPPDMRADICQDLAVGILCGDFARDSLSLPAKEMTKRVMKMFPTKYGPISLDAPIPGTDGLRLIDTI